MWISNWGIDGERQPDEMTGNLDKVNCTGWVGGSISIILGFEENLLQEKSTHLLHDDGADDYVPPLGKQQSTEGAPSLPPKLWTPPADATIPAINPPSLPKTKLVRECFITHSRILKPLVP
jgi:hypothetical protein